jgi:hypothetical protein
VVAVAGKVAQSPECSVIILVGGMAGLLLSHNRHFAVSLAEEHHLHHESFT